MMTKRIGTSLWALLAAAAALGIVGCGRGETPTESASRPVGNCIMDPALCPGGICLHDGDGFRCACEGMASSAACNPCPASHRYHGKYSRCVPTCAVVAPTCVAPQVCIEDLGVSRCAEPTADGGGCTPLAPAEKPIQLGTILGAGRASDGTIYVVDHLDGESERLFSSRGGTLYRVRVAGTGSGNEPGGARWYLLTTDDAPPLRVKVEIDTAGGVKMGVHRGPLDGQKSFAVGALGETLTTLPPAEVAPLPVRNLAGEVRVEYLAALADGRRLLVTVPRDDFSYEAFRLFLGDSGGLVERKVLRVERQRDGGSTRIAFLLDGAQAEAWFPVASRLEPATVTIGGKTSPITVQDPKTPLAGLVFRCL